MLAPRHLDPFDNDALKLLVWALQLGQLPGVCLASCTRPYSNKLAKNAFSPTFAMYFIEV